MKRLFLLIWILFSNITHSNSITEGESLYQLDINLIDQAGNQIQLDAFRGQPLIISMFYATCPHVCPLTISTIQMTESALTAAEKKQLRVILVSLDSEQDTPQLLTDSAKKQKVDTSRWKLTRADSADVRKLAAVLGIRFRKLPDGEFNHSTVITLLDSTGVPIISSSQLGSTDEELISAIKKAMPSI